MHRDVAYVEVTSFVLRLALFGSLTYFGMRWIAEAVDPGRRQRKDAQKKADKVLTRLGIKNISLTEHELAIAAQLVDPECISVTYESIGGLDDIVQEIRETVILPIQRKGLFAGSNLIRAPKGVLLYGPPGCGKTMIAKATAKEAGARFINLEVGSLTDKMYGESQKLAAAVFTLAVKIQPCFIFIDEIDSFLRVRQSHDHEATAMMKAVFMTLWDGLVSENGCDVLVMGATNRPQDVDRAILRRMPAMFHVALPNVKQRIKILELILGNEPLCDEVDMESLAKITEGFSGSDLTELCRSAAMNRVRSLLRPVSSSASRAAHEWSTPAESRGGDEDEPKTLPPITLDDFMDALKKMRGARAQSNVSDQFSLF